MKKLNKNNDTFPKSDDEIKELIQQEGFDTNVKADWYIWIEIYKIGKYGVNKK